jgi:hypothetical protein
MFAMTLPTYFNKSQHYPESHAYPGTPGIKVEIRRQASRSQHSFTWWPHSAARYGHEATRGGSLPLLEISNQFLNAVLADDTR